jgi:hypothetical protein
VQTYNVAAPAYVSRAEALPVVRALLDSAAAALAATPPSTFFTANILTPGLNLPNTVQLFRARYARMAGTTPARSRRQPGGAHGPGALLGAHLPRPPP